MSRTGTFLYVCDNCSEEVRVSRKERDRRSQIHCISCGSTWLSPKTKYARLTNIITRDGAKKTFEKIRSKQGL